MRLLSLLACSGGEQAAEPVQQVETVQVEVQDGMAHIPGGWIQLGPEALPPGLDKEGSGPPPGQPGPPPGGQPGPPTPPPGQGPGQPGQPGQPPGQLGPGQLPDLGAPLQPGAGHRAPVEAAPWTSTGGQQLEPRRVRVESFWMDQTEVTRAAYARFLEATGYRPPHVEEAWAEEGYNWQGSTPPAGTEDHPVLLTSWYDAQEYCLWAGKRLPTEAEWQLAALGPEESASTFPWGETYAGEHLNHGRTVEPNFDDSDGYELTSPVGAFPSGASRYGLQDMFGNVWEFTSDFRVDSWDFTEGTQEGQGWTELRAPGPGLYVAVRGGSYFFDVEHHPAGERNHFLVELRRKTSGFRCAKDG